MLTLEELYYADFEIMEPELVLQSWNDSHSYTGYQCSGRPYDGLMLITGDIRMEFSMIDGVTVTAAKNDLVYLPMGLRYTVRIEWEAAALPRIQDLLFNFILRDENGQALSLSDIPLIVSRDGERFEKYFQALSAACHAPKRSMVCVKAEAYRLLRHVLSFCVGESEKRYPIRAGVEYLKLHWNENTPVSELAALCGIPHVLPLPAEGAGRGVPQRRAGHRRGGRRPVPQRRGGRVGHHAGGAAKQG